jgi:hypothetical protein
MLIQQDPVQIEGRIKRWLEAVVIGLNLCPFASAVLRRGQINIVVADSDRIEDCLQQLTDEADALVAGDLQATTLFVLPLGFSDFDDYLDLLAMAEALLEAIGLDEQLQLASFHPEYQFEDTDNDDPENWTNRAPYPILHLLTEHSVSLAVDSHPDPEGIPETNIEKLRQMGTSALTTLNRAADG